MKYGPATIVHQLLLDLSLVTDPVLGSGELWPGFVGHVPDGDPDNVVAVYDTLGDVQGKIHRAPAITLIRPGIQIQARSLEYNDGFSILSGIAESLDEVGFRVVQFPIDGTDPVEYDQYRVWGFTRGGVLAMGQEPQNKRRSRFALNCYVTISTIAEG